MASILTRAQAWLRSGEQEILLREIRRTAILLRRPAGLCALSLAAAICAHALALEGKLAALEYFRIGADPAEDQIYYLWRIETGLRNAFPFAAAIFFLRRRTFSYFSPGRCRDLALSRLDSRSIWPGVLGAPIVGAAVFAAIPGAIRTAAYLLDSAGVATFSSARWRDWPNYPALDQAMLEIYKATQPIQDATALTIQTAMLVFVIAAFAGAKPIAQRILFGAISGGILLWGIGWLVGIAEAPGSYYYRNSNTPDSYSARLLAQAGGLGMVTFPLALAWVQSKTFSATPRVVGRILLAGMAFSLACGTLIPLAYWGWLTAYPPPEPRADPVWIIPRTMSLLAQPLLRTILYLIVIAGCAARFHAGRVWQELLSIAGEER